MVVLLGVGSVGAQHPAEAPVTDPRPSGMRLSLEVEHQVGPVPGTGFVALAADIAGFYGAKANVLSHQRVWLPIVGLTGPGIR
jgi:hypothetical protein